MTLAFPSTRTPSLRQGETQRGFARILFTASHHLHHSSSSSLRGKANLLRESYLKSLAHHLLRDPQEDIPLLLRVDGRVLNFLTVDDLFMLKVTNQLHHLSIKHGIKVGETLLHIPCLVYKASCCPSKNQKIQLNNKKQKTQLFLQVLRDNDFQPSVLRRRGEPGERESQVAPGEVLLWTNHR